MKLIARVTDIDLNTQIIVSCRKCGTKQVVQHLSDWGGRDLGYVVRDGKVITIECPTCGGDRFKRA